MTTSQEHPLTYLLRQLELYSKLPEDDRRRVLELPYRLRRLDAGSYLVREGDTPTQCMVLASGYAFRSEQSGVTGLNSWGTWAGTGSLTTCGFNVH